MQCGSGPVIDYDMVVGKSVASRVGPKQLFDFRREY